MKKMMLFTVLLCGLIGAKSAQANEWNFSFEMSTDDEGFQSQVRSDSVRLYNFSDELLAAVEHCSAYQEDFLTHNPDLKDLGALFGNTDFEVLVDIKGENDSQCAFSVTQRFSGLGGVTYACAVTSEQRREILEAMKDRSETPITETFETISTMEDGDGNVISEIPVKTTMTGSKFDIVYSKVLSNSCQEEPFEPTSEETQKFAEAYDRFSDRFKTSLQNCSPDTEEKTMFFFSEKLEIIGEKDGLCVLRYDDMEISVPAQKTAELMGFEGISGLFADDQVKVEYKGNKDDLYAEGLLSEINACFEFKNQLRSGASSVTQRQNIMKKTQMISSSYVNEICTMTLTHKIEIGEKLLDYSRVCTLSEADRTQINERFTAENEKDIITFMLEKGLCRSAE